jgi:energy-coupling factor transporter ATP-binding protein EcfA2
LNWLRAGRCERILLIEIDSLRYAYRQSGENRILDGIHLKIRPEEYLLICGASGSGKSTLCRTFNGLIPHFFGGWLQGISALPESRARSNPSADFSQL